METPQTDTITIQNGTAEPIEVRHPSFSMIIPPNEAIAVPRDALQADDTVICRYATVRGMEVKENRGFMRKKNGRKQLFVNEHETTFTLLTAFHLKDVQEIALSVNTMPVRVFAFLKATTLRRIIGTAGYKDVPCTFLFPDSDTKQRFVKRLRICPWFLPVAFLFILGIVDSLFQKELDWIGKATVIFFYLLFTYLIVSDTYYYFAAKKWACFEN